MMVTFAGKKSHRDGGGLDRKPGKLGAQRSSCTSRGHLEEAGRSQGEEGREKDGERSHGDATDLRLTRQLS
jgi:hypothetical protein